MKKIKIKALLLLMVCLLSFSLGKVDVLADETSGQGTSVESKGSAHEKDKIVILEGFTDEEENPLPASPPSDEVKEEESTSMPEGSGSIDEGDKEETASPDLTEEVSNRIEDSSQNKANKENDGSLPQSNITPTSPPPSNEKEEGDTQKENQSSPQNNSTNENNPSNLQGLRENLEANNPSTDGNRGGRPSDDTASQEEIPSGDEGSTYLEDQKNDTLVIEIGPKDDDIDLGKRSIFADLKKRKKIDDEPNAQRISIHLFGVFFIAITLVISIKFFKSKNFEK